MSIESLGLTGNALEGAKRLRAQFPSVVFTSGRRGVEDQARAMAQNVAKNRRWIEQTYTPTPESKALQAWIDAHPAAVRVDQIKTPLATIMATWTDEQKGRLSKHFSGHAFDVQPVGGAEGARIKAAIRALPGLQKFLEREGGLVRWHAQFT